MARAGTPATRVPDGAPWVTTAPAAGIDVSFYDPHAPHAPWQRAAAGTPNGLLRQYLPKGFDFSTLTETELDAVADEFNDRPHKRVPVAKPCELLVR